MVYMLPNQIVIKAKSTNFALFQNHRMFCAKIANPIKYTINDKGK